MAAHRHKKSMKSALAVPVAVFALCTTGLSVLVTGAVFNDSTSSAGNTLATGVIDLTQSPTSTFLTMSNMFPGDSVVAPITVSNAGTSQLRYALGVTASNTDSKNLAGGLSVTVKTGVTTCTTAGFDASGTTLTGPTALGSIGFGNAAQGAQAGDRNLDQSVSETLCVRATLPLAATNTLQNATTTATLTFSAEQTKNN